MKVLFLSTLPKAVQITSGLPMQSEILQKSFDDGDVSIRTIFAADEPLPEIQDECAIVIGGSSHSVYDSEPWIVRLEEFVRKAVMKDFPVLGICFGHQLVSHALGGRVALAPSGPEIGPTKLSLTKAGEQDWLFEGIPSEFISPMLHHDLVIDLPDGKMRELAYNQLYRNQALAYGNNVRTVQFHPEFTRDIMAGLIQKYTDPWIRRGSIKDYDHADYLIKISQNANFSVGKKLLENFLRHAQQ